MIKNIAILQAYHERLDGLGEGYLTDYERIVSSIYNETMAFSCYDLPRMEFPESINQYFGFIITGSPDSVNNPPIYMENLVKLIVQCDKERKKIFGICFGHQIIASALGSIVGPMDVSWNLGLRKYDLYSDNVAGFHSEDWKGAHYAMHNEQILQLSSEFSLLGSVQNCKVSIVRKGDHILSTQMHPELNLAGFTDIVELDPHVPISHVSHEDVALQENLCTILSRFFI